MIRLLTINYNGHRAPLLPDRGRRAAICRMAARPEGPAGAHAGLEARIARVAVGNFGDTGPGGRRRAGAQDRLGAGIPRLFRPARTGGGSPPLRRRQEDAAKGQSTVRKRTSRTTRRARLGKSHVAVASLPYEPWLIEQLKDPAEAAAYLEAVIEDGDQAARSYWRCARSPRCTVASPRSEAHSRGDLQDALQVGQSGTSRSEAGVRETGLRIAVRPIEKRAA